MIRRVNVILKASTTTFKALQSPVDNQNMLMFCLGNVQNVQKDIGGKPLSKVPEVLAKISRFEDVIMTRWVVMIPAAWPLRVSCHLTWT